jgi:hypothetical protein
MSSGARPELQYAALMTLISQNERPRQLSSSHTFDSNFSDPRLADSDRPIRFLNEAERMANGLWIAFASAGHLASIPRSLSAVRFFLFTFWARHAGPLPFGRIWRTPIARLAHTKCAPGRHARAHSGGHRGVQLSRHARGHRFRKDRARCGVRPFRLQSELSRTPTCAWVTPVDECPRARGADISQHATRTWIRLGSLPSCGLIDPNRCGSTNAQHSRFGARTRNCT